MIESSRSYLLKTDRLIVPMSKGEMSRRVLDLAFDISGRFGSEITAFTVKDEVHDLTWSDKVSLVTGAYRDGKGRDIKVVPKVRTSKSVKECIVDEINSHSYDMVLIAMEKRSPLSATLFGNIGEYVLKHARIPVVSVSVRMDAYPYRNLLIPLSENLATRAAVAFALRLKKACGAKLHIADLRKYDTKPTHGFQQLFNNMGEVTEKYGPGIEVIRGSMSAGLNEALNLLAYQVSADAVILGVRPDSEGRIRINSMIKNTFRDSVQDVILVKK